MGTDIQYTGLGYSISDCDGETSCDNLSDDQWILTPMDNAHDQLSLAESVLEGAEASTSRRAEIKSP